MNWDRRTGCMQRWINAFFWIFVLFAVHAFSACIYSLRPLWLMLLPDPLYSSVFCYHCFLCACVLDHNLFCLSYYVADLLTVPFYSNMFFKHCYYVSVFDHSLFWPCLSVGCNCALIFKVSFCTGLVNSTACFFFLPEPLYWFGRLSRKYFRCMYLLVCWKS